eukprot:11207825-Lingulodinium_polyedra.AAC.1
MRRRSVSRTWSVVRLGSSRGPTVRSRRIDPAMRRRRRQRAALGAFPRLSVAPLTPPLQGKPPGAGHRQARHCPL